MKSSGRRSAVLLILFCLPLCAQEKQKTPVKVAEERRQFDKMQTLSCLASKDNVSSVLTMLARRCNLVGTLVLDKTADFRGFDAAPPSANKAQRRIASR